MLSSCILSFIKCNSTLAPLQSAPIGGFCLVIEIFNSLIFSNALNNSLAIFPATFSIKSHFYLHRVLNDIEHLCIANCVV